MSDFTKEDFIRFADRVGNRGAKAMLEALGRSEQFIRALELPVGKELLGDLHAQITKLHKEVLVDGIGMPPEVKRDKEALLRAYLIIGERWASKINSYQERIKKVME